MYTNKSGSLQISKYSLGQTRNSLGEFYKHCAVVQLKITPVWSTYNTVKVRHKMGGE